MNYLKVKILRVDSDERKIGLSRKRVEWAEEAEAEAEQREAEASSANATELRGGIGSDVGPLIKTPEVAVEAEVQAEENGEDKAEVKAEDKGEVQTEVKAEEKAEEEPIDSEESA